jgi:hypothetical protein
MEQNSSQKRYRLAGLSRVPSWAIYPVVQPMSKTINFPRNCLFDEFRRTNDMSHDLHIEGLHNHPPQSGSWNALERR